MTRFVPTIGYLCVLVVTTLATSNWTQEARDYILDIHNEKRRGEGGCQMNKMVYDLELERQARKWAENCVFRHESKEGRGENLAYSTYKHSEKDKILKASDDWFNEKDTYSYGQHSCGSSCHYTQMVWGKTSKVGCYSHTCPYLTEVEKDSWYLVCFYTPKGRWDGEKPYDKECKTKCGEGQTEEQGLCVGDIACKDDEPQCDQWAKNRQCEDNAPYMKRKCMKSCKVCASDSSSVDKKPTSATEKVESKPTSATEKVESKPTSATKKVASTPTSATKKLVSTPTSLKKRWCRHQHLLK
ncbi:Cysteine-rich secretory protein LCCL domain-containing 2 [Bulinus truncatus]|nr:Cysteine-rich secretory protein LCCL domain-containing 2 [Bulinus truncatus]